MYSCMQDVVRIRRGEDEEETCHDTHSGSPSNSDNLSIDVYRNKVHLNGVSSVI